MQADISQRTQKKDKNIKKRKKEARWNFYKSWNDQKVWIMRAASSGIFFNPTILPCHPRYEIVWMVVVKVNCTQEIFLKTERERSSSIIFYLVLNLFSNWIIESVVGSKRTMKEVISGGDHKPGSSFNQNSFNSSPARVQISSKFDNIECYIWWLWYVTFFFKYFWM